MRRLALFFSLMLITPAIADELDAAFQAAAAYKIGDAYAPLEQLADAAARAQPDPSGSAPLARRLAALLEDGSATFEGRLFAARQLWLIAGPEQVPALAKSLEDPKLSDMARYALERMPAPEAGAALGAAMDRLKGEPFIGVVNSLVARGDPAAVAALRMQLRNPDPAAVAAVKKAIEKLTAPANQVPTAEQAIAQFNRMPGSGSLHLLEGIEGLAATRAMTGVLPRAGASLQEQILLALAERGDRSAAAAALPFIEQAQTIEVRLAAIRAAGLLCGAEAVPALARSLGSDQTAVAAAARESLALLNDPKADAAILAAIPAAAEPVRVALIKSLPARRSQTSAEALLKLAGESDSPAVRRAAFDALGDLASDAALPELIERLNGEKDPAALPAAQNAVAAVARRIDDEQARLAPILKAHSIATGARRASLLQALGKIGGSAALAAARHDLSSDDPAIRDAAVRTLADWSDDAAAGDLLNIATAPGDQTHQLLALRGYIRMAGANPARDADATIAMFSRALAACKRPDEKRLILSGLSTTADEDAAALVEKIAAGEPKLKKEADAAAVKIAKAMEKSGKKKRK